MNLDLTNKNAFVGGASKGIGKAVAQQLANMGANVIIASRSETVLEEVLKTLDTSKGQQHSYAVMDYSNRESVKRIIKQITGNVNIHILINNTGGPPAGLAINASIEEFVTALNNHLLCNHILAQAVVEGMKKDEFGRIVNIISTSVKQPIDGLGVSNTTRGAVANWSKTLANELAQYGITVNNVLPGSTSTDRLFSIIENRAAKKGISVEDETKIWVNNVPAKRFADPSEIANAVGFLASPAASYINGINVPVDGGRTKSL